MSLLQSLLGLRRQTFHEKVAGSILGTGDCFFFFFHFFDDVRYMCSVAGERERQVDAAL